MLQVFYFFPVSLLPQTYKFFLSASFFILPLFFSLFLSFLPPSRTFIRTCMLIDVYEYPCVGVFAPCTRSFVLASFCFVFLDVLHYWDIQSPNWMSPSPRPTLPAALVPHAIFLSLNVFLWYLSFLLWFFLHRFFVLLSFARFFTSIETGILCFSFHSVFPVVQEQR